MKSCALLAGLAFLVCFSLASSGPGNIFGEKKFSQTRMTSLTLESQTALKDYDSMYKEANEKFLKLEEAFQGKGAVLNITQFIRINMGSKNRNMAGLRQSCYNAATSFDKLLVELKEETGEAAAAVKSYISPGSPFATLMDNLSCAATTNEVENNKVEKCKTVTSRCRPDFLKILKQTC